MTPRQRHLHRHFGITEEQYQDLLDRQGGGCGICGKTPEQEGQNLAVDHEHDKEAPKIRGVLCRYCNHRVLGRHRNSDLLRRMADYLDNAVNWPMPVPPKRKRKKRGPRV